MDKIFLDNNATTKLAPEVLEAMIEAYSMPLNASSVHYFGRTATRLSNNARKHVQKLLGAQNYNVIFTSGGTEADNLALYGFGEDCHIFTSDIEHPAIFVPATRRNATLIKVDENSVLDLADLEERLKKFEGKNFIVSIMLANNETGSLQPIKEAAKITHQHGGLFHSDIVQAAGKLEIDLEDLNVDLASISSHKINGPQGMGALLVRKELEINPIIFGSAQEGGKRPGTLNVPGAIGFGKAAEISLPKIAKYQELASLRDYLEDELAKVADDDLVIFAKDITRLPNTSYVAMKGVDNQTQLIEFDLNGISISVGSACSSGSAKPSRILAAMGVSDELAKNTIRVSLSTDTTKEEIDKFISVWTDLFNRQK